MSDNILSVWHSRCEVGFSAAILPDGCRDLIVKIVGNEKPAWYVSPLFDRSESIDIEDNSNIAGFRFRPGIKIKESELISHLTSKEILVDEVTEILDDFIRLDSSTEEALGCLASDIISIKQASVRLGVNVRTLQRLILNKTGRTPGYWFQLARVRKAAKSLNSTMSLADVSEIYGFSDQSHMNREFQRWFKSTPTEILNTPELIEQLSDTGYC
ncbi:MAG: helix-turn-helix domain-containing protein [Gammaproteobacteria bacterium]|nr:helix-turn-helix domain-containing protein [Gammaproteobacteria bacterium]